MTLGAQPKSSAKTVFEFLTSALDFAIFLRVNGHPQAIALGVGEKEESRNWIHKKVRECARDPNWQHSMLTD